MTSRNRLVGLALILVVAVACADDSESSTRCKPASRAKLDDITSGLTVDKGQLRNGVVVRSNDFESVFFIAAELDAPGLEGAGDIGVWASNRADGSEGTIFAVDGIANEFSEWPDGRRTDAEMSIANDGADEARSCA